MKHFGWLSLLTTILTYPLIGLGAIVRLKGAGLACPDWPLCYGQVTPLADVVTPPPEGLSLALEVGHRYVAGIVGLLVLALLIWAVVALRKNKRVVLWASIAFGLLVPQVLLGALTVTMKLDPWTVASHLLFGNLFFASLIVLCLVVSAAKRGEVRPWRWSAFSILALGAAALTFAQLYIGGWTSSSGAGFACVDFPQCVPGFWFPESERDSVILHMAHRGVGFLLMGVFIALAVVGFRDNNVSGRLKGASVALIVLVIAQILVGWYNVENLIPVPTSALHTALAAFIVGTVTYITTKGVTNGTS